jgi:hypothetical protein
MLQCVREGTTMARAEGLRRIKLIVKVILFTGAALLAISVSAELMDLLTRGPYSAIFMVIGAIGIYLSVFGGVIALITRIIEGFLLGRTISQ